MTTARIVEKSVTVNNSSIQDYTHPGDHILPTYEMIPGFKRFTDKTKLRVLMFRAMHSVVEGYFPIRPLTKSFLSIAMYIVSFKTFWTSELVTSDLLVASCSSKTSDGSRKGRLSLRLAN